MAWDNPQTGVAGRAARTELAAQGLACAERVANAVLYEGYVLYPYRASAPKNRLRWQLGALLPQCYVQAAGSDSSGFQIECLAEVHPGAELTVRVRALHVQERRILRPGAHDEPAWTEVDELLVGDRHLITWEEAVPCEFVSAPVRLGARSHRTCWRWTLAGSEQMEEVDGPGVQCAAARVLRRRLPVAAAIEMQAEMCGRFLKIRLHVSNVTSGEDAVVASREAAARQSLGGAHAILTIDRGGFLSLLDPPEDARAVARACVQGGAFPVLVGPAGSRAMMLASPVLLYDYPVVAPESTGDFCDATEIDELLTLRVRTLTETEKAEVRATDERAAAILGRCEAGTPATLARLHGTVRPYGTSAVESWEAFLNPDAEAPPEHASALVAGTAVGRGSRVRLQPRRSADPLDICVAGRTATVTAVYRTLEGDPYVAVALDDDPFGQEGERYRRSLYFHPDELALLEESGERA